MNQSDDDGAWKRRPLSPNCVTIFGAGVAGLTAAHELVERGFRVQIWEKIGDPRYPHQGPDVGGMARTQWSRVEWLPRQPLDQPPHVEGSTLKAREATPIVALRQKLVFIRNEDKGAWYVGEFKTSPTEAVDNPRPASVPPPPMQSSSQSGDPLAKAAKANFEKWLRTEGVYFILRVRDYEATGAKEQEWLVRRVLLGLQSILGKDAVSHAPEDPEFEITLPNGKHVKLVIRPAGVEYFSANTYARIEYYIGPDYATGDSYFGLEREWERGDVHALGEKGEQDPKKVLQEFAKILRDNKQIQYVYVESSDRDAQYLDAAETRRRADVVHKGLQKELDSVKLTLKGPGILNPQTAKLDELPPDKKATLIPAAQGGPNPLLYSITIDDQKREVIFEIVLLREFPSDIPPAAHLYTAFRVRERWLPGEHGYRLFPNCYRHLFDTMTRTPIFDTIPKAPFALDQERAAGVPEPAQLRYIETGRTVFDNILPTTSHLLAFENGAGPSVLSRSKLKSIDELRQLMNVIFGPVKTGAFEVSEADAARLSMKMLQYIISCPARREQYARLSWWDFVDGDSYGERLGNFLEVWPEALVAMDAKSADARSHGDSLIQVTLDQFREGGFRDGTLRGPVSEEWFRHWRRYLEAQGVEFLHGELTGFEVATIEGKQHVLPVVDCLEPRYPMDEKGKPRLMPGYFVLAVSADQAAILARKYAKAMAGHPDLRAPAECSDIAKAADFDDDSLELARPPGDFRHFAGLQYYFAEDIFWAHGHVYYPDSPWSLSSVSQARFWNEKTDWEHGFRGILSVIIATWDKPGELIKKCAWECTPGEIAEEVWYQIKRGVERRGMPSPREQQRNELPSERLVASRFRLNEKLLDNELPEPLHWHLDENLVHRDGYYDNLAPFHIARPGKYRCRPGSLVTGYAVENAFVMCGMYTQTFFRLPTMEAANESARHAVNAILKHVNADEEHSVRRTLCEVWDPEMYEFDSLKVDLQSLKDLDDKLVARGLPHLMEIIDVDRLTRAVTKEVGLWDIKGLVRTLLALSGDVLRGARNEY